MHSWWPFFVLLCCWKVPRFHSYWLSGFYVCHYMSICDCWQLLVSICCDYPTAIARCENFISRSLSRHNGVPTGNKLFNKLASPFPIAALQTAGLWPTLTHSDPPEEKGRFSVVTSAYLFTNQFVYRQHLISSTSRMVCAVQDIVILLH